MTTPAQEVQTELERRHRKASTLVLAFVVLDLVLVVIAYFAADRLYRPGLSCRKLAVKEKKKWTNKKNPSRWCSSRVLTTS